MAGTHQMKYIASRMKNLENMGKDLFRKIEFHKRGMNAATISIHLGDVNSSERGEKRGHNCIGVSFVSVSDNRPNFLTKELKTVLAEPSRSKSFFYTCAIEADSRIGPPANIVEENVDSDSEARPRGVSLGQYKVLATVKDRGREKENSATEARSNVLAGTGPVSLRLSIVLATVAEHIAPRQKLAGGAYSAFLLPFFVSSSMSEQIANQ